LARGDKKALERAEAAKEAKKQGDAAAAELEDAMSGPGTKEAKVFASLKGKTPEQIEAIKQAYKERTGHDLEEDLTSELSDLDLKEARALLSGDPVRARVAALQNAMSGLND